MGTIHHLSIGDLVDAIITHPTPNPTLPCDNCEAHKPPSDIALLWVHSPVPDKLDPRLMFICDDCNITLTAQGCRLLTLGETVLHYKEATESLKRHPIDLDYPHLGTGGG